MTYNSSSCVIAVSYTHLNSPSGKSNGDRLVSAISDEIQQIPSGKNININRITC